MHDAAGVRMRKGPRSAHSDARRSRGRDQTFVAKQIAQRLTGDQLHDQEHSAAVLAEIVYRHDPRVRQAGDRAGFTSKSRREPAVGRQLGSKHLDGDGAVQTPVDRLEDLTHAAVSEVGAQLVAGGQDGADR